MVRANADIAKLTIGKEIIRITPASPEVGLPARPASGALVDAVASDGRTVRSMIPSSSNAARDRVRAADHAGPGVEARDQARLDGGRRVCRQPVHQEVSPSWARGQLKSRSIFFSSS